MNDYFVQEGCLQHERPRGGKPRTTSEYACVSAILNRHGLSVGRRNVRFPQPAFCSIMGYEREQLLGKHVDSIRHPADIESLYEAKPKVLDAIGLETSAPSADPKERRFVDRNGNTIWANVAVSVLRTSPGRQLYFIQVQAITEHKPCKREPNARSPK